MNVNEPSAFARVFNIKWFWTCFCVPHTSTQMSRKLQHKIQYTAMKLRKGGMV